MDFSDVTVAWTDDNGALLWRGGTTGGCVPKDHPRFASDFWRLEEIGDRDPALPDSLCITCIIRLIDM